MTAKVATAGSSTATDAGSPSGSSPRQKTSIDSFGLLGCCGADVPLPTPSHSSPSPSALNNNSSVQRRHTHAAVPTSSHPSQSVESDAALAAQEAGVCRAGSATAADAALAAEVAAREVAAADGGLPVIVKVHDIFNLLFIGLLNCQNVYYLCTGRGFGAFYMTTMLYFLADLVFVGVFPLSVKSPVVILTHHIITSLYILIPYNYPQYEWCMAACMLVEINTWLLIAKRTVKLKVLEVLFYVTWIGLRNIFYPYLIYAFYKEWQSETASCGSPWNPILLTPVLQLGLTGLNCHWTHALFFRNKGKQQKQL